jgi:hypothetical protein
MSRASGSRPQLDRLVAIKELQPNSPVTDAAERFLREVKMAAASHPGSCRAVEVQAVAGVRHGLCGGRVWLSGSGVRVR